TRPGRSDGADDLAGLQAGGADVQPLRRPVGHGAHLLDVRVPAPLRPAVGVRDAVAEARGLAADVTRSSHGVSPLGQSSPQGEAAVNPGLGLVAETAGRGVPSSGNRTRVLHRRRQAQTDPVSGEAAHIWAAAARLVAAAATPRLPVASLPPACRCPRIPSEAVAHTSEDEVWGGDKRALIRLVGDRGAKKLQQLDIHSPQDLLRHYPRKYFHRGRYTRLRDLVSGEHATVMAQVLGVEDFRSKKRPLHVIKV